MGNGRSICLVAAVVAIAAGCSGNADRVHVLGRDYDRAKVGPMNLTAVHEQSPSAVIVSHGKLVSGTSGTYAPTVVFVKDSGNYYEYALSGGP